MAWATAKTIINRAAVQLGISNGPASSMGDPYASTDPKLTQMCEFLTTAGRELARYDFPQLRITDTITTTSANEYDLPADFIEMVEGTAWNRTTDFPMLGPLTDQEWQYLFTRDMGSVVQTVFRIRGNKDNDYSTIEINPNATVTSGETLAFEYRSRYWAMATGGSAADKDAPTVGTDVIFLDEELVISWIKLAWLTDRGFDTEKAEEKYHARLADCVAGEHARTIKMGGGRGSIRQIDDSNLPFTGWG